jgi:hypothetical protein
MRLRRRSAIAGLRCRTAFSTFTLEDAARALIDDPWMDGMDPLEKALDKIKKLLELNRGMWARDLKQ